MIRNYEDKDYAYVMSVLECSSSELANEMRELICGRKRKEENDVLLYDKDGIHGIGIVKLDSARNCGRVELFVHEDAEMYVAAQLDDELASFVKYHGFDSVVVELHGVNRMLYDYYETLGYEYWFGYHEMLYSGGMQPDPKLTFVPYEDSYFEKYIQLQNEGFYDLRKENDIKPFLCCELNEKTKQFFSGMKNDIYLCFDEQNEIICSFSEANGHLDDIVVSKAYQNQGFGQKVTRYAINQALKTGAKTIHLDVVIWNQKARHIYEKLGFNIIETVVFFRKGV